MLTGSPCSAQLCSFEITVGPNFERNAMGRLSAVAAILLLITPACHKAPSAPDLALEV